MLPSLLNLGPLRLIQAVWCLAGSRWSLVMARLGGGPHPSALEGCVKIKHSTIHGQSIDIRDTWLAGRLVFLPAALPWSSSQYEPF